MSLCDGSVQSKVTSSKGTNFYWNVTSDINSYNLVRKPGEMREIGDISDYELSNSLFFIALDSAQFKKQKQIKETELIHALVRYYGYGRVTTKMQDTGRSAVNLAISRGYFERIDDELVSLG